MADSAPAAAEPATSEPYAWAAQLAQPFLARLGARLHLQERGGPGASTYVLRDPAGGARSGAVQVLDGDGLQAAVLTTADTPLVRIWQLVAFSPPSSAVPHLSFEASANARGAWLSLDLVPRAAPTEEPAWTSHVYEPLSEAVWDFHTRADQRQSLIRARHRMRLSPWLVTAQLESAAAVAAAADVGALFTDRFCDLLRDGVPAEALPSLGPDQLAERDARERAHLYSWDATANYRFLTAVGGEDAVDVVQAALRDPGSWRAASRA